LYTQYTALKTNLYKNKKTMNKPKVICHMMTTVDGKIITENWRDEPWASEYTGLFEKYHYSFQSEAWILGCVSMERDFSGGLKPEPVMPDEPIKRVPFIGNPEATSFAVAVDGHGKLGWETNETGGDHIIQLLTESVSDAYLYYLQRKGISYIFAGLEEIDFRQALEQLAAIFPIKTLMLEGGGHLNGSFLNEGLIDELSLLILPIADGTPKSTSLFEVNEHFPKQPASLMKLEEVKQIEGGTVWLKYSFSIR
jgi:riboflavin biosynthesis pyrimidine reductase